MDLPAKQWNKYQLVTRNLLKYLNYFSEQFISVLPNVYSRSEERSLGLLDHLMLIFGSTVRSSQPNFLPGKNKTYGFGQANGSTIADMANL